MVLYKSLKYVIFSLAFSFMWSAETYGQDTLYTAQIMTGPNAMIYTVDGKISVIKHADSANYEVFFHDDVSVTRAPDLHMMLLKKPEKPTNEGNASIILHRFEDGEEVAGPRRFTIDSDTYAMIDSFPYIGFVCVEFNNIYFGGGKLEPVPMSTSNRLFLDGGDLVSLDIYPNPTSDRVSWRVEGGEDTSFSRVYLLNSLGGVALTYDVRGVGDISTASVPNGHYYLLFVHEHLGSVLKPIVINH